MLAQTLTQSSAVAQGAQSGTMVQQDMIGAFGESLLLKGKGERTTSAYAGDVRVYVKWVSERYGGEFDLEMINRSDLRLFYQHQTAQERVSPATWNRRRASLRVFAQWAQGQGLLSYDPTDGLPKVEEIQLAPHWLDGIEAGRLESVLGTMKGDPTEAKRVKAVRDRAVVLLMLKAGLREGEVCQLTPGDLNIMPRKGTATIHYGKGNKSRGVPLNKETREALQAWLDVRGSLTQPCVQGALSQGERETALFLGKGGVRLQERGIQRLVEDLGRIAKIDGLTPHRLRHTCAKNLLDAGTKLTEVAKILGHGRLDTTMRYTTPSEGDLAAAVEKI